MYYIGVDIGGMSIKTGIVNEKGEIIAKEAFKTLSISPSEQMKKVSDTVNNLLEKTGIKRTEIKGIGVGCPGAINGVKGIVSYSANLKWHDFNLKSELEKFSGLTVRVGNDADAATLGEFMFGAAKGYSDVVMLTVGTGIGGGIIINKKLYEGSRGMAAELGHTVLILGGLPCGCGRRGCFEQYASATALIRQTKEAMFDNPRSLMWKVCENDVNKINGITAFAAAKLGDETANRVVYKYVAYLSEGILDYCNVFRPELFIIGGGISKEGDYLINKIENYLNEQNFGYYGSPVSKVVTASLKNDAGIIGAASLIAENKTEN